MCIDIGQFRVIIPSMPLLRYRIFIQAEAQEDMRLLAVVQGKSLDTIRETIAPLLAPPNPVEVDPLARFRRLARRPGRPVRVVALHPDRAYVQVANPPGVGEVFESATDFAEAIGSSVSTVSTALAAARRRTASSTAVVRGVEFGYVSELPRVGDEEPTAPSWRGWDVGQSRDTVVEADVSRLPGGGVVTVPHPTPDRLLVDTPPGKLLPPGTPMMSQEDAAQLIKEGGYMDGDGVIHRPPGAARPMETITVTNPPPALRRLAQIAPPGTSASLTTGDDGIEVATFEVPARIGQRPPRLVIPPPKGATPSAQDDADLPEPPPAEVAP